jgi:polyferredoxin
MSLKDLVILLVVILGIVLFLYGSNAYDAVFGWAGVFMIVGGVIAYAALEVYGALRKRRKLETVES